MKSFEFIIENSQKGTYAGVRFSETTKDAIAEYMKQNKILNPVDRDKLHTTLLYSRKYCPEYKPAGDIDPAYTGKPGEFDVWESQEGDMCLVLEYKCPQLETRHNELMEEHDATFDYPEYKTHITFSYDIGDMDINDLPKFASPIEVVSEYGEDLDLDWAKNNTGEV